MTQVRHRSILGGGWHCWGSTISLSSLPCSGTSSITSSTRLKGNYFLTKGGSRRHPYRYQHLRPSHLAACLVLHLHHPLHGLHEGIIQDLHVLCPVPHRSSLVLHMVDRWLRRCQWLGHGLQQLCKRKRCCYFLRSYHLLTNAGD